MQSRVSFTSVGKGLTDSLSIGLGYFPIAVSFGLAAIQAGFPPWLAILVSLTVYAGAAQFVLVALAAAGAGAFGIISTVLLMNVRHLFYGPSILDKLGTALRRLPLPILAFGLTDEVYAASIGRLDRIAPEQRQGWYMGMQLGAYASWVSGTAVGALLGHQLGQQAPWLRETLDFVLPALFFALLLEILRHTRLRVTLGAMLATAALLMLLPGHIAMLGGLASGALLGAWDASRKTDSDMGTEAAQ